ncbi:MAG: hypothetical protein EOO14_18535 [Chitinophagaceae bacterium]|nr:MAG: hypothetical protein EOO14_18535 [Chitinophagaceae bacterium]
MKQTRFGVFYQRRGTLSVRDNSPGSLSKRKGGNIVNPPSSADVACHQSCLGLFRDNIAQVQPGL